MLVYTTVTNQQVTDHAHATATAQTHATSDAQSATNTAIAELQATETAQASVMMTASANATATATQIAKGQATATAQAIANSTTSSQVSQTPSNQNPYPPYTGILALNDPLIDNSQGHTWEEYSRSDSSCQFVNGLYESTMNSGYPLTANLCSGRNTDFTNFAYQVQMTLIKGNCGGISFRGDAKTGFIYEFMVCANATYLMDFAYGDLLGSPFSYGPTPVLHKGIGQTYILAVVAIGNTLTVYANYQKVATVVQHYSSHGHIGCGATLEGLQTAAIFRNAMVWVL